MELGSWSVLVINLGEWLNCEDCCVFFFDVFLEVWLILIGLYSN